MRHWLVKGPLESCRTQVGGRATAFRAGQLQHTLEVTALHSTTLSGSLCDLLRRGQGSRITATAKKCPGYPALVGGHMLIYFWLPSEFRDLLRDRPSRGATGCSALLLTEACLSPDMLQSSQPVPFCKYLCDHALVHLREGFFWSKNPSA